MSGVNVIVQYPAFFRLMREFAAVLRLSVCLCVYETEREGKSEQETPRVSESERASEREGGREGGRERDRERERERERAPERSASRRRKIL